MCILLAAMCLLCLGPLPLETTAQDLTPEPFPAPGPGEEVGFQFQNGTVMGDGFKDRGFICARLPSDPSDITTTPGMEVLVIRALSGYAGAPVRITATPDAGTGQEIVTFPDSLIADNSFAGRLDLDAGLNVTILSTPGVFATTTLTVEIGPAIVGERRASFQARVHTFALDPRNSVENQHLVPPGSVFSYSEIPLLGQSLTRFHVRSSVSSLSATLTPRNTAAAAPILGDHVSFGHSFRTHVEFYNPDAEQAFHVRGRPIDASFGAEQEIFRLNIFLLTGPGAPAVGAVDTRLGHEHDFLDYAAAGNILVVTHTTHGLEAVNGFSALSPIIQNVWFGYDLFRPPVPTVKRIAVDRAVVQDHAGIPFGPGLLPEYVGEYVAFLSWDVTAQNLRGRIAARWSALLVRIVPRSPWQRPEDMEP